MQTIQAKSKNSVPVSLESEHELYDFFTSLHQLGFYPNTEQWNAIMTDVRHLLIHAGAGSGKTTTLIGKMLYLIQVKKINPSRIMLLTFTRKSAEDMQARMSKLIPSASEINAGTFHSIFGQHLIKSRWMQDLYSRRLLKDNDRMFMVSAAMKKANVNKKQTPIEEIETLLTFYKNTGIEPDEVVFEIDKTIGEVYYYYEQMKSLGQRMDFDDIILEFLPIASEVGKAYDAILVDEFQDVSTVQMECLKLLSNGNNAFIAVGDPDQSIYSWRGSNPDYILHFDKVFNGAKVVQMGTNYRSHAEIVQCGMNVVAHNKNRTHIDLFGVRESDNHPTLFHPKDDRDEAIRVVGYIQEALKDHNPTEIAVLFRNGYYAEAMISELTKEDIPFRLESDSFTIYDKPIVRSLMAMMKARTEKNNLALIKQFAHLCYLSNDEVQNLKAVSEAQGTSLLEAIPYCEFRFGNQKAKQLVRAVKYASSNPYKAVDDLLEWYVKDHLLNQGLSGRIQLEEVDYFKEVIEHYKTVDELFEHANELREQIEKAKFLDENVEAITLSTIHRSKGLEWEIVFLIGVIDEVLFDKQAPDIEEERRLAYVGLTRAKEHLFVFSPRYYAGKEREHQFVDEMMWVQNEITNKAI